MGENNITSFGKIKVSEIMVSDPLFTHPNEKISSTELIMLRKKIGGLPVVNENKQVIGIITQRDIRLARFAISLDSPYTVVNDLMTPEPIVIKEGVTVKEALELMFSKNIERLPVVNETNQLKGLVLQQAILQELLKYL